MNDDWRLQVELHNAAQARALTDELQTPELEHDLERAYRDRVVVSFDGQVVFCYAASREQAQRTEEVIRRLAVNAGWELSTELRHWHPTAEEWEDPDEPLPGSQDELAAERDELMQRERAESLTRGYPEFEVRVQCQSHAETVELSQRLRDEGLQSVNRWRYLLVGAMDEDSANALAERLSSEVPSGSTVTVEATGRAVLDEVGTSPFAVLGGLAG
jgi:nucleotide-binding universal stress UspA family protein